MILCKVLRLTALLTWILKITCFVFIANSNTSPKRALGDDFTLSKQMNTGLINGWSRKIKNNFAFFKPFPCLWTQLYRVLAGNYCRNIRYITFYFFIFLKSGWQESSTNVCPWLFCSFTSFIAELFSKIYQNKVEKYSLWRLQFVSSNLPFILNYFENSGAIDRKCYIFSI